MIWILKGWNSSMISYRKKILGSNSITVGRRGVFTVIVQVRGQVRTRMIVGLTSIGNMSMRVWSRMV